MSKDCWIQTFKGGTFHVFDPRSEEIDIEDIAHALALMCRWNGHCRSHLSVAQHAVLVSRLCPRQHRLWGLLHDGAEAYLGDLPEPIKRVMPAFRDVEDRILRVIGEKFGLCWPMPPEVKRADKETLLAEKRDLITECRVPWTASAFTAAEERITPWTPERAERVFLTHFRLLTEPGVQAGFEEQASAAALHRAETERPARRGPAQTAIPAIATPLAAARDHAAHLQGLAGGRSQ